MPLGDEDNQHKSSSQAAQRATDMTDSPAPAPGPSKFELVQKAVMSRLGHKKDSSNIFSERECVLCLCYTSLVVEQMVVLQLHLL